jgi:predicted ATPase/DNA-binding SARP family transcriptional activator
MLKVRLLGKFNIQLSGAAVNIPSRAEQSLLAFLILNAGNAFRREYLAGLFWPESDETNAKSYLRLALWRLRKTLAENAPDAPDYFLADRITLAFDSHQDYWLDVAVLEKDQGEGSEDLIASTQVYSGELLPGFYDEWVMLERERLRVVFDHKMQRLLEKIQSEQRWEELIQQAERWIALGDVPEPAYRALILGYAARGNKANALAAYNRLERAFEKDLGAPPSPETSLLVEQIRTGELPFQAEPVRDIQFLHNLPARLTNFIGREDELNQIAALLVSLDSRLITLSGPGGMGKSRAALKVSEKQIGSHVDGVYFVSLAGIDSVELLPSAIMNVLNLEPSDEIDPKRQIFNYLQDKELLLVLDNFEHLIEGRELLSAILGQAPGVTLLVTSRERLNLKSEWVFPIEGLPFPDSDHAAGIEQYDAVNLFIQTAKRVRANFKIDETNKAFIARICRLVEGIPLAIELSAAWIQVLDPEAIANKVEHGLDILEANLHDLPVRQRSMRAVFDASWNLLSAEEQTSMEKLSVFRGGFNLGEAENAFGISIKMILTLVNKCWVQPENEGRFQLHELLRQYAFERLHEDRDLWQQAGEDHSTYFCHFLHEREVEWHGPKRDEIFAEVVVDIQNIETAWKWALDRSRLDLIGHALESLCYFYKNSGRRRDAAIASQTVADHLNRMSTPARIDPVNASILKVRALTWQGKLILQHQEAIRLFNEANAILEGLEEVGHDVRREKAALLLAKGNAYYLFNPERAWQISRQSAPLYETLGDEVLHAEALTNMGVYAWALGDLDNALRLAQQSLAIHNKLGNLAGIDESMDLLGKIFREKGQFEDAEEYHHRYLISARKSGFRSTEANCLINLAHTLICAGKFEEAQARAQESSRLYEYFGYSIPYTSFILAMALLHQGQYAQARIYATKSLEGVQKNKVHEELLGLVLNGLAEIDLAENRLTVALERLQKSIDATQVHKQVILTGMPLANLGYTSRALNQRIKVSQYLWRCIEIASSIGSFKLAIHAMPAIALLEADQGNVERAIELYALASKYPYVANSKWFENIAGDHITRLAAALPMDTVTSARNRGASLDFWEVIGQWLDEREHFL